MGAAEDYPTLLQPFVRFSFCRSYQMATILQHYQKVTSGQGRSHCPQQLVAVAKRWNSQMDQMVAIHMPYPCIVVGIPAENLLYGNVQQVDLDRRLKRA